MFYLLQYLQVWRRLLFVFWFTLGQVNYLFKRGADLDQIRILFSATEARSSYALSFFCLVTWTECTSACWYWKVYAGAVWVPWVGRTGTPIGMCAYARGVSMWKEGTKERDCCIFSPKRSRFNTVTFSISGTLFCQNWHGLTRILLQPAFLTPAFLILHGDFHPGLTRGENKLWCVSRCLISEKFNISRVSKSHLMCWGVLSPRAKRTQWGHLTVFPFYVD